MNALRVFETVNTPNGTGTVLGCIRKKGKEMRVIISHNPNDVQNPGWQGGPCFTVMYPLSQITHLQAETRRV